MIDDDELLAAFGNLRFRFWVCPVKEHRRRTDANGGPVETVRWEGDVARCTAEGCGRTSADEENR